MEVIAVKQYSGILVREIKKTLLEYHKKKFKIFPSVSLLSNDNSVMFTNAAITPFKDMFLGNMFAEDYAIIQQCFRCGGTTEMDCFGSNPYSLTAFEMFGSGLFGCNLADGVGYLLEILDIFSLDRDKCYFISPPEELYSCVLQNNQIPSDHIFVLEKNSIFWQEWDFGQNGLTGKGYTVVVARDKVPQSIAEMETDCSQFIELLNLIHVYGQKNDGQIISIANPGIELGIGVERLAAVVNDCDCYHIDTIDPVATASREYFSGIGYHTDEDFVRIATDHILSIFLLSYEGIEPSNKSSGYVLRKMIRKLITNVWLLTTPSFQLDRLVNNLSLAIDGYDSKTSLKVKTILKKEVVAMQNILRTAKKIARQHPELPSDYVYETYGVSSGIMAIARREI